jgi:uncharacterized membrane-anchored protein
MSDPSDFRGREAFIARRAAEATDKVLFVTKWWLDLVKGLVVLVALEYAAKKTGNRSIQIVALITTAAVILHSMALPLRYAYSDWTGVRNEAMRMLLMVGGTVCFAAVIAYSTKFLPEVVESLMAFQAK